MAHRRLKLPDLPAAVSPYCDAVLAGNILFVSGCTAVSPDGQVMHRGDAAAQARQALAYVKRILEEAGATVADVTKITVYLRNMEDRAKIVPVRAEFFGENLPASTLVEVNKLFHEDLLVEMEVVAVLES